MKGRDAGQKDQAGHVTVWLLIAGFGLLGFIGLVGDGGRAMLASEQLNDEARAAARAGASAVDQDELIRSGAVILDTAEAEWRANQYLQFIGRDGDVTVTPEIVLVDLTSSVTPRVLGLFGVGDFSIVAHAEARAALGVEQEDDFAGRQP